MHGARLQPFVAEVAANTQTEQQEHEPDKPEEMQGLGREALIIGGAFGLISFLQCFGICGSSALGAALVNVSPFLMFVQRFVSRVLVGVLAALVYKVMCRTKAPLYIRGAVTGFSAAFFNTLFFMTLLVIFFGGTEKLAGPIAEKGVFMYIITSVGINALVELVVAALVTGAAGVALKKARLI